jgi:cytochrome c553
MTTRTTLLLTWLSLLAMAALGRQSAAPYSGESLYLTSCASCHGRYGALAVTMQDLRYLSALQAPSTLRDRAARASRQALTSAQPSTLSR